MSPSRVTSTVPTYAWPNAYKRIHGENQDQNDGCIQCECMVSTTLTFVGSTKLADI